MSNRIARRFDDLRAAGRGGLVTFITAGDPDANTSLDILKGLPAAGADIIELGMAFSDPMADGPAIQASSQRALKAGANMEKTLDMVRQFRQNDNATPLVLMGYYNPVYVYGVSAFANDAAKAGVDGLIIVDLPPEEAEELLQSASMAGINVIYLTAPTTDDARLPKVIEHASGFVYYASITGITGTKSATAADVAAAIKRLRRHTDLPIAVGFGVKTPKQAAAIAAITDAVVVGSALVDKVAQHLDANGFATCNLVNGVLNTVRDLSNDIRKGTR